MGMVSIYDDFVYAAPVVFQQVGAGPFTRIAGVGGLLEVRTAASSGSESVLRTRDMMFPATRWPVVTARFRTVGISYQTVMFGLGEINPSLIGDTRRVVFRRVDSASPGNWMAQTYNGNAGVTDTDLGITGSSTFLEMAIVLLPTEAIFFVDGHMVAHHTSSIPSGARLALAFDVRAEAAQAAVCEIDYLGGVGLR